MKITKAQILNMIKEQLEEISLPPEAPISAMDLAQAQFDNTRSYTNADPKEKDLINKLETSLLQSAGDTNLLSEPLVIRALELLNQALEKAK